MPVTCPSCGEENPERARFCLACGTALAERLVGEERKTVSVLFVDLVAFTARSDAADPEDVRATLRPYHERVREELARFGGTVEKFVGDAVMAVFGAPVAHEDDAERAVRAGLRILEATDELGLEVRAAVATGEAVVQLGARPEAGEGIATGDVVNTAARLQSVAPPGGLVVGELTYRATRNRIDYEELEPVTLKGKSEPVPLWQVTGARSRFGVDVEIGGVTPFVGREHELTLLRETYGRVRRDDTAQLVTLVGEPGVGKTRVVRELAQWLDDQPDLVYWRQGRCLPYGEGITFWALGEVVKAQAGILESDGPDEAEAKLAAATDVVAGADRDWVRACLAPLVGTSSASRASREESFTAWRTFLEGVAAVRPLVLLVEDIHWADAALLEFLDHLLDWSTGVPLLVLCTARPELYDRHPGWGGGKRNSTTVTLSPLSADDTARLVAALLGRPVLPAETQSAVLERAGGNPLYAEEFARMLADRGGFDADTPLPETVQALIAARIDTLAPEAKALLHDASVVGKVFWAEAVGRLGERDLDDVLDLLNQLGRKELIRPVRASSMEGAREFSFWHLLVRDVAYGQIPRRERAQKHVLFARWLEESVGERVADHAELLAHHYTEALQLSRAAGEPAGGLAEPARRFLALAGDRAMHLDAARALSYYERALELWPEGDPGRLRVAFALTRALSENGRWLDARALGDAELAAAGEDADPIVVGALRSQLGHVSFSLGEMERSDREVREAVAFLEQQQPTHELVTAYGRIAGREMFFEGWEDAIAIARKALALADELEVDEQSVNFVRQMVGASRVGSGDLGGFADLEDAVDRASGAGISVGAVALVNLGSCRFWAYGPGPALEEYGRAVEYATRRGIRTRALWARAESLWALYELGRWDELLAEADDLIGALPPGGQLIAMVRPVQARVLWQRGDLSAAAAICSGILPRAREIGVTQVVGPALSVAASVAVARGDRDEARARLVELAEIDERRTGVRVWYLPATVRAAVAIGDPELGARLIPRTASVLAREQASVVSARATLAEAVSDTQQAVALYREAAELWQGYGSVVERAYALAGLGRASGNPVAAAEARTIFASLGVMSYDPVADVI